MENDFLPIICPYGTGETCLITNYLCLEDIKIGTKTTGEGEDKRFSKSWNVLSICYCLNRIDGSWDPHKRY